MPALNGMGQTPLFIYSNAFLQINCVVKYLVGGTLVTITRNS